MRVLLPVRHVAPQEPSSLWLVLTSAQRSPAPPDALDPMAIGSKRTPEGHTHGQDNRRRRRRHHWISLAWWRGTGGDSADPGYREPECPFIRRAARPDPECAGDAAGD